MAHQVEYSRFDQRSRLDLLVAGGASSTPLNLLISSTILIRLAGLIETGEPSAKEPINRCRQAEDKEVSKVVAI